MTPSEVGGVIRNNLPSLPWEFATRDTFKFFENPHYHIRCYANIGLRRLEKDGLVSCVGFGTNRVCIWQKKEPRPIPEWI